MNVRIVPRGQPTRTDLYSSIEHILCFQELWMLLDRRWQVRARIAVDYVAEVQLDEEGAVT